MTESSSDSDDRKYVVPNYVSLSDVRDETIVLITPKRTRELQGSSVRQLKRVFDRLRDGGSVETLSEELGASRESVQTSFAALDQLGVLKPMAQPRGADSPPWVSEESEGQDQPSDRPMVAVHDEFHGVNRPRFDGVDVPRFDGVTVTERDTLDEALNAESMDLLMTVTPGVYPAYHRRVLDEGTFRDTPWLPVRFAGDEIRIGPLHHSEVDGCFDCQYRRLVKSADNPEATLTRNRYVEETGETIPYDQTAVRLGLRLALGQANRFLDDRESVTVDGSVLYVDLEHTTTELGDVIPISGCQVCEQS